MVTISKKIIIVQGSRRGGGSNCLFPIETHITCDFPGGGPPVPPLDPHLGSKEVARVLDPRQRD